MITQQQLLVSQKNFPHIAFTATDLQETLTELRESLSKHGAHVRKRAAHSPVNEKNLLEPHIDGLQRLDTFLGKLGLLIEASSKNELHLMLIPGRNPENTRIGLIVRGQEINLDEIADHALKYGEGDRADVVIDSISHLKTFLFLLDKGRIGEARGAFKDYCNHIKPFLSVKELNERLEDLGAKERLDENRLLNSFEIYEECVSDFLEAYGNEAELAKVYAKHAILLLAASSLFGFPMILGTKKISDERLIKFMEVSFIVGIISLIFCSWSFCFFVSIHVF